MAAAGLAVELVFGSLGLIPQARAAIVAEPQITLNYTSVLNVLFLAFAAVHVWRAARTGGFAMLRSMDEMPMSPASGHST